MGIIWGELIGQIRYGIAERMKKIQNAFPIIIAVPSTTNCLAHSRSKLANQLLTALCSVSHSFLIHSPRSNFFPVRRWVRFLSKNCSRHEKAYVIDPSDRADRIVALASRRAAFREFFKPTLSHESTLKRAPRLKENQFRFSFFFFSFSSAWLFAFPDNKRHGQFRFSGSIRCCIKTAR